MSNRGKKGPPPLPMYQPVVLKHVPTMIRRRYQHFDVNTLDQHQDASLNDGESEKDGYLNVSDEDEAEVEEMGPGDVTSESGSRDSEDNDLHDLNPSSEVNAGVSTDDCETGTYSGSVSHEIIQPAEYSSEDDGTKVSNHVRVADFDSEDEILDKRLTELKNEHGDRTAEENGDGDAKTSSYTSLKDGALGETEVNSVNEEDLPSEYSENDLHDLNPSSEVDPGVLTDDCETGTYSGSVSHEIIQPADLRSEYRSEDDGTKVANHVPVADFDSEDETLDKRLTELKNEHDGIGEENGDGDAGMDRALGETEVNSVNEEDLPSEYGESEVDGTEVANCAPIVDSSLDVDGSKDERLAEFSDVKGSLIGDCKDDVNEAGDANTANFSSLKDEVLDITEENSVNEQELNSGENKQESDDAEDESPSFCANMIASSEVEEIGHGSLDDKLDTRTQLYNEDFSSENIVQNRSLDLEDFETEGDSTSDMSGSTDPKDSKVKTELQDEAHWSSDTEDFNPDDFKKTVEEDGYELCCPYCKHCITKTIVYHRRENNQHCRITCFTSLFAIFCCIRD